MTEKDEWELYDFKQKSHLNWKHVSIWLSMHVLVYYIIIIDGWEKLYLFLGTTRVVISWDKILTISDIDNSNKYYPTKKIDFSSC